MYPYLKLLSTLLRARRRPPLRLDGTSEIDCRVGVTDTDPFLELNNARYFVYMELGRWDFSWRVGFVALMREHDWAVAVGGASVRYRKRIRLFRRFRVTTRMLCHDGRWFYLLQEFRTGETLCTSALMRMAVTSKTGLVPVSEVLELAGAPGWNPEMPGWVAAWIEAEGRRPWERGNDGS